MLSANIAALFTTTRESQTSQAPLLSLPTNTIPSPRLSPKPCKGLLSWGWAFLWPSLENSPREKAHFAWLLPPKEHICCQIFKNSCFAYSVRCCSCLWEQCKYEVHYYSMVKATSLFSFHIHIPNSFFIISSHTRAWAI